MHDVWPVLFIAYRSKAEDALKALKDGTLSAAVGSGVHIRRGAQFILALDDGRILGTGEVVKAFKEKQELSVRYEPANASAATTLPKPHFDRLKALLGGGNRPPTSPIAAWVIPTDGKATPVDVAWFDEVTALVEQAAPPPKGSTEAVSKKTASASESGSAVSCRTDHTLSRSCPSQDGFRGPRGDSCGLPESANAATSLKSVITTPICRSLMVSLRIRCALAVHSDGRPRTGGIDTIWMNFADGLASSWTDATSSVPHSRGETEEGRLREPGRTGALIEREVKAVGRRPEAAVLPGVLLGTEEQ
jgi:hypothetical protein